MSEMIERIAKQQCPIDPDSDTEIMSAGRWYRPGIPHWHSWIDDARGVLEAIRVPTETMIKAGARAIDYNSQIDEGEIADMWRAMVDVARGSP